MRRRPISSSLLDFSRVLVQSPSPATPSTVLRLLGLRAGPLAIDAITVWIVRRPSRRAHKRSRLERLGAPSVRYLPSNPWIFGTIVSAAAHSPTRCRIASATARNRRHVARIVSSAARNPRLCSDCERGGSSRIGVPTSSWARRAALRLSPRRCRIASEALTIAQRCYGCEECCSQSFDF